MKSVTLLVLAGIVSISSAAAAVPTETLIPRADVETYYKVQEMMDNKLGGLFDQLVGKFGYQDFYTPNQVQWPFGKKKSQEDLIYVKPVRWLKTPDGKRLAPPTPPGAFPAEEAYTILRVHAARTGSKEDLKKALWDKFDDQPYYLASELRDVEDNGSKKAKIPEPAPVVEMSPGWQLVGPGLRNLKIRQSWSDVLYSEDPSVGDVAKKKVDDLVGATFSYTHDFLAQQDNWSAIGALILPLEFINGNGIQRGLEPVDIILAPSISVDRVTNSDPKKEIDEMYYRLGSIVKWLGPRGWLDSVQLRGALVYGTDTEQNARLPAYEADIEPSISWRGIDDELRDYFALGYRNVLLSKEPDLADETDNSRLDYQLRAWLHLEGGDLQQAGTSWNVVKGSFFRLGPVVQMRANAPTVGKGLSFTALYSYLPSVTGTTQHDSLLKLDLTLALYTNPALKQKVSLNADYTRGGLDFTKQDVDSFTLSLAVLF
jgi:hypothetical protein